MDNDSFANKIAEIDWSFTNPTLDTNTNDVIATFFGQN